MDLTETVIRSETIYNGRIVHLKIDTVRLPDGREAKREVVVHNGAVAIVPVLDDGTVLMVRQYRVPAGKVLLEIPAGTLESGEEPLACAHRELEEETGYRAAKIELLFSAFLAPGYSTERIHAYVATGLTKSQAHTDEDEIVEIVQISTEEIQRKVLDGEIEDAKSIAAILAGLKRIAERGKGTM